MEAAYAGTSFVGPRPGRLRYGSPAMSVTADATTPGGLGTFAFDDEGVPPSGRRWSPTAWSPAS
jgi:TldD protein